MGLIILKIILCSSLFIAGYYLFLEKEKMYRFNRFFLIFSLVFSYVAPFISITTEFPKQTAKPQLIFEETTQEVLILPAKILPVEQENFDWTNITWIIYGIITLLLLSKACISILKIKNLNGKKLIYQNHNIIATKENFSPFSFWNTIYIGENHLVNNKIDTRIFLHEKGHLDQKHSLDLLLIEILKIFTWFNPAIFLYKKAIVTNHELLADEAVLENNFDIRDYQNLILQEIISTQKYNLTHSFNFNNTKKRFKMMTTKKSKFIVLKKIISIPVFIVAFVIFVQKTYANDTNLPLNNNETSLKNTEKVLSAAPYEEFKNILNKYSDLLNSKKYPEFTSKVSKEDKQKLENLYFQLTDEQKNEQRIVFYKTKEPKKKIPTEAELNTFTDKSKYAVWIDDKKIDNNILKNYKASDFANVSISGVYKNARTSKNPQPFQVTLSTPAAYEKYLNERSEVAMGFKVGWETMKSLNDTATINSVKVTLKNINDEEKSEAKFVSDVATPQIVTSDDTTAPEYPGGSNQLRKNVSNFFDGSKVESLGGQAYKCEIKYIVNETGKLANVEAEGNNEVFNSLSKSAFLAANKDVTWKPATKDGKAVRYRMKMPLIMSFQNFR